MIWKVKTSSHNTLPLYIYYGCIVHNIQYSACMILLAVYSIGPESIVCRTIYYEHHFSQMIPPLLSAAECPGPDRILRYGY